MADIDTEGFLKGLKDITVTIKGKALSEEHMINDLLIEVGMSVTEMQGFHFTGDKKKLIDSVVNARRDIHNLATALGVVQSGYNPMYWYKDYYIVTLHVRRGDSIIPVEYLARGIDEDHVCRKVVGVHGKENVEVVTVTSIGSLSNDVAIIGSPNV